MKSLKQKRTEALARLRASTWEDSKAKRLGTLSEEEWEALKAKSIANLGALA